MMLKLPSISRAEVERIAGDRWRATGVDPRFQFAPWLLAAPYIIFEIEDANRVLFPKLYLDHGAGFRGEEIGRAHV